jgi:hypothetical protein
MTPHRVNWRELLTDLAIARLKPEYVAARAGVTRPAIVTLRKGGTNPLHQTGERLIGLWCETTGKDRAQLPCVIEVEKREQREPNETVKTLTNY